MKSQTHIINKVSIELTLPAADEQAERSEQAKTAVQSAVEKLNPMLDKNFGDSFYQIDKLSVEMSLPDEQLSQLEKQLQETLAEKILSTVSLAETSGRGGTEQIKKQAPEDHRQELLIYFLQTGRFPWWAEEETLDDLEKELRVMSAEGWLTLIQPLIHDNPEIISRLAAQFSEELVRGLIKKFGGEAPFVDGLFQFIENIKEFIGTRKLAHGMQQQITSRLYEQTLRGILFKKPYQSIESDLIGTALSPLNDTTADIAAWKEWLQNSDITNKEAWLKAYKKSISKKPDEPADSYKRLKDDEEKEFSIFNSGLVLLHPFLKPLFENLGLLEEGIFVAHSASERAVCLLHFLTTGSEKFPEPELVLPKFLVGWPMERPVNRFLPVSNYEKEECRSLLLSAINHWAVLKNTSIDGLRSNFLQRNGLLRQEAFGWSLYVERETQDILLERLPWGLSIIKHKWMDEMLTVHWP